MKYKDWLVVWINNYVKMFVKQRTYEKYERIIRTTLIPSLGEYDLKDLSVMVLQGFVVKLTQEYSANTVMGIVSVLKNSLKQAVKVEMVKVQHTDGIICPKIEEKSVECFSVEEQRIIENYVVNCKKTKYIGILICLYTGIRIGELFALTWHDVDFNAELLYVTKSCHDGWNKNGYYKIIESPKTTNSNRVIPIPKAILPYLKRLKSTSRGKYLLEGDKGDLTIRSYQRTFELMLKKLQIPHRGFHSLRHTFATRALECGMDVKTLSELLGHCNSSITLNRYVHSMLEYKYTMMNKLGKSLQTKK